MNLIIILLSMLLLSCTSTHQADIKINTATYTRGTQYSCSVSFDGKVVFTLLVHPYKKHPQEEFEIEAKDVDVKVTRYGKETWIVGGTSPNQFVLVITKDNKVIIPKDKDSYLNWRSLPDSGRL